MSLNIIPFLVTLFLLRRLSRTFLIATRYPAWKKIFKWSMLAACALFIPEIFFRIGHITLWAWHFIILLIIGLVFVKKELRSGRITIMAVLPYELISLASDLIEYLSPKTFNSVEEYSVIAIFFSIIWAIAMWIYANNQQRKQERERIKREHEEILHRVTQEQKAALEITVIERTAELTKQKEELQLTLQELQETQAQLIQSEKMASLGELTAGIAHEIQNPLNFVNNFSEVSVELAAELKDELNKIEIPADKKTNLEEIVNDIVQNQEKINFHGKRADAIVKGMLQHSRSGSGQKEPTDINELVDEYLRLSYHGLRAKDNTFNAVMKTGYDESIGKINIIPQEMGRVVLNLFTNAFYANTM
ncbi:MAG: histidine kinase [Bacteroidota bacterium]